MWSGRATVRSTLSITPYAMHCFRRIRRLKVRGAIDYKVRILDQGHGTDATVRVLIETTNSLSAWTTVGVGQNSIRQNGRPLCDACLYGLIHTDDTVVPQPSDLPPIPLGV